MPHDDDFKCSPYQGTPTVNYVMSRMLDHNTNPWSWSNCSRHFLTEYLDAGYGDCLHDEPIKDILAEGGTTTRLPGENYTEDDQCELVYGRGSKICSYMPVCKRLWCTTAVGEQEGCRTQHMPWADGTSCGDLHWCQKGACVPRVALRPVDGNWGEWQKYGECSRTCGGGVKKAKRDCNDPAPSNGGRYCVGHRERYRSCNIKECPLNSQDFREEQCAKFNNNNFNIQGLSRDVQWTPKYGGIGTDERCKLYCHVAHSTAYYLLREKVYDGTVCGPDTFDICVNGVCRPAGCDHRLASPSQLDFCGQCGGNNASCQQVAGQYNASQYGYSQVLRIPSGSSNLDIRQNGWNNTNKDDNYLALKDGETGVYVLNGNYVVSMFRKLILYGGTTLEYSGSDAVVERINSSRPLTKDLIIEVLSVGSLHPPNMIYQYTVQHSSLTQYSWELSSEWSACNRVCNGESRRLVKCIRFEGRQEVATELCHGLAQPHAPTQPCNDHCDLKWQVISQSECSSHCGDGQRTLTVQCMQQFRDPSPPLPIHNTSCGHIQQPRLSEPCYGPCDIAHWQYTEWGPCSKSCGTGIERRAAECVDDAGNKMDDPICRNSEKIIERLCNTQKCPKWAVGDWSPCSVTCGEGERHRPYWCLQENITIEQNYCSPEPIPHDTEPCNLEPCPEWITDKWSQCSVSCGLGVKSREVRCSVADACTAMIKPPTTESCFVQLCTLGHENAIPVINSLAHYVWRTREWGLCSESCGGGLRRRVIYCYDEMKGREVNHLHCTVKEKPSSIGTCQEQPCPTWVMSEWSPCSATCGQGVETRAVLCMDDGRETEESFCTSIKPSSKRICSHHCATPTASYSSPSKWRTGPWSDCSVPCGGGEMSRQVACLRDGDVVSDDCGEQRPVDTVGCHAHPCSGAEWKFGGWSKCNQTCGGGHQHRQVQCHSIKHGIKVSDKACPAHLRPLHAQACNTRPCDRHHHFRWKAHPWGPCSVPCGVGSQRRSVECRRVSGYERVLSEESDCDPDTRPSDLRSCHLSACPYSIYTWVPGDWQPCSHSCGKKGRQIRRLFCYNNTDKRKVARKHCNRNLKPKRKRKCNQKRCGFNSCKAVQQTGARMDKEYTLNVAERNISIFCFNMNTVQPLEYLTLPTGQRENYAEVYDCRLTNPDTCPGRKDNCSFILDPNGNNAGLTVFEKIRLNITSLKVDTKDWTFSYQLRGVRVPFGEAGDCYSRAMCPEGRFSINLSGTGLRISPYTDWQSSGPYASHQITRLEGHRKVVGKCGGYCGTCGPTSGMKLDVLPP